jgi:hypothetical protein
MGITYNIDQAQGLISSTIAGTLTDADVYAYIQDIWGDPSLGSLDELLTIHPDTRPLVTSKGFQAAAILANHYNADLRPFRLAIVAPTALTYALARMYAAYQASTSGETRVFWTREDALAWLRPS